MQGKTGAQSAYMEHWRKISYMLSKTTEKAEMCYTCASTTIWSLISISVAWRNFRSISQKGVFLPLHKPFTSICIPPITCDGKNLDSIVYGATVKGPKFEHPCLLPALTTTTTPTIDAPHKLEKLSKKTLKFISYVRSACNHWILRYQEFII